MEGLKLLGGILGKENGWKNVFGKYNSIICENSRAQEEDNSEDLQTVC